MPRGGAHGLAHLTPERRQEIARSGGVAYGLKATPERKREIALLGVAARLAKVTPERRREISRLGAAACNLKRWGPKTGVKLSTQPPKGDHDGNGSSHER